MPTFWWVKHSNTVLIPISRTCWIHNTLSAKGWPLLVRPPKTSWNIKVTFSDVNKPKHLAIAQSIFSLGKHQTAGKATNENSIKLNCRWKSIFWVHVFKSESWLVVTVEFAHSRTDTTEKSDGEKNDEMLWESDPTRRVTRCVLRNKILNQFSSPIACYAWFDLVLPSTFCKVFILHSCLPVLNSNVVLSEKKILWFYI